MFVISAIIAACVGTSIARFKGRIGTGAGFLLFFAGMACGVLTTLSSIKAPPEKDEPVAIQQPEQF